jgi:hypothetical protein
LSSFILELAKNVVENTSVLEVSNFGVGIKTALNSEFFTTVGRDMDILADLEGTTLHVNVKLFTTVKAESLSRLSFLKLEGKDSHSDEVGAMDTLVALSNHSLDTLEVRAFSGPVAGGSRAIFSTSKNDSVNSSFLVLVSGVKDGHLFSRGNVLGSWTNLVDHLVNETDVGESTTSHDLIVTTTGTVGVKVLIGNSAFSKIASSRRVLGNLSSRGDVIGGDRVTEVEQAVGRRDVADRSKIIASALEEGRVVDVG